MMEEITALVIHQNCETLATLQCALELHGMRVIHAASCAQANRILGQLNPVPLVFTDTNLPDGTWADILAKADKAAQPVNVIVVARVVNTRFYMETIEPGAFDFLVLPFVATDLAYVVRNAMDNLVAWRCGRPHGAPTAGANDANKEEAV